MIKNFESLALRRREGCLEILDQREIPYIEVWTKINSVEDMIEAIQTLQVRGAPLIGVAAAQALADFSYQSSRDEFLKSADRLRRSRPTAVNLMHAIDRLTMIAREDFNPSAISDCAQEILERDVELCENIALNGQRFIEDGDSILTHCNTGGLATVGIGTALGILKKAKDLGKEIHVYVDETRPLLQGGRLTTWELEKQEIPYTLICDSMAAQLMNMGKIDKVLVGADRLAINGDFANKIGTYSLAALCHLHKLPFLVAAPQTTIDFSCKEGKDIPIEERPAIEVKGFVSKYSKIKWAPSNAKVYNPAFDVTPSKWVHAWIFDHKVYLQEDFAQGKVLSNY